MTQVTTQNSLAKGRRGLVGLSFLIYFFFLVLTCSELITQTACPAIPVTWHTQQHTHAMHRTAVKHKLDLERMLQASTVHRNAERPSTQTCTMASTKGWFCMQCHAVNRYRKGFRALTFAKAKKIMAQCCMYRDCLQAVHYSREQAMTKQENKGKKQKQHGAVVKFKNTIWNSYPGACFGSLAQAAHAWDWCLSTQRWAQLSCSPIEAFHSASRGTKPDCRHEPCSAAAGDTLLHREAPHKS